MINLYYVISNIGIVSILANCESSSDKNQTSAIKIGKRAVSVFSILHVVPNFLNFLKLQYNSFSLKYVPFPLQETLSLLHRNLLSKSSRNRNE